MLDERLTRRQFIRRGSGLLVAAAAGLTLAPKVAEAAPHNALCHAQFGPLHRFLWSVSPDPLWADGVIWRESRWEPSAYNRSSGATGLAQFLPSTWAWGCERFGVWGDPWDPYENIGMMSLFLSEGEYYHWACGGQEGCYDL